MAVYTLLGMVWRGPSAEDVSWQAEWMRLSSCVSKRKVIHLKVSHTVPLAISVPSSGLFELYKYGLNADWPGQESVPLVILLASMGKCSEVCFTRNETGPLFSLSCDMDTSILLFSY